MIRVNSYNNRKKSKVGINFMEDKLLSFIQEHRLVQENKTILVGVSGGPDSMALLHFLKQWKDKWNLRIIALTIDHRLRAEESQKDVEFVRKMCRRWSIPFITTSVNVDVYMLKHKVSTQVAARKLRYQIYKEQMNEYKADYLALGHHGDDQIETILMSLSRNTNLGGLTGIPFRRDFASGEIIRPLLCVTKSEIEQYCLAHEIEPRIDPSNSEIYYTRNYMRHHIVPKLKERNDYLHMTVQRLSESLQEDEQYLMNQAEEVLQKTVKYAENGKKASFSVQALNKYPVPLQRRVYRLTLDYLYEELPDNLSHKQERIFLSLLEDQTRNQVVHFPNELVIERSYDKIYIYFQMKQPENKQFHRIIDDFPEQITLPNGDLLSVTVVTRKEIIDREEDAHLFICSKDDLSYPLHLRTRKAGDKMRYKGLRGSKKIKDIFIDEKIPRHKRDQIYILADDSGEIFWLVGLRKKEITEQTSSNLFLIFEYKQLE